MARTLVRLRDRYRGVSRMTLWRMKRDNPDFPAGIDINGTEYFVAEELTEYEEARRRNKPAAAVDLTAKTSTEYTGVRRRNKRQAATTSDSSNTSTDTATNTTDTPSTAVPVGRD